MKQLRDAGVQICSFRDVCPKGAMPRSVASRSDVDDVDDSTQFPERLGPLSVTTTTSMNVSLANDADRFTVELRGDLAPLAGLGFSSSGVCSPAAQLPECWPAAPPGAVTFRWANPVEGMSGHHAAAFHTLFLNIGVSCALSFVAYGGFLLLDGGGQVVAVQPIMGGAGIDGSRELHFTPRVTIPENAVQTLSGSGRLQTVTLPALLRRGAKSFCWINPKEQVGTVFGAFLYTFASGQPPIAFHLVNPRTLAASPTIRKLSTGAHGTDVLGENSSQPMGWSSYRRSNRETHVVRRISVSRQLSANSMLVGRQTVRASERPDGSSADRSRAAAGSSVCAIL